MRRAGDMSPRSPRRLRSPNRWRIGLVVVAVALLVVLTSLRGIAGFYTDLLWFDSLGYRGVFTAVLGAQVSLAILFTLLFFAIMWVNLFVADRVAPKVRASGPDEEIVERFQQIVGPRVGLARLGVSALFALVAGLGVSGQWQNWILFRNAGDFGIDDPQFGIDAGFYVFQLPFLSFVVDWAFASVVTILFVTAVAHYLNGGIRVQGTGPRVTPQVKGHLSVLLALLALIRAVGYWFDRLELTLSSRGVVDGATYTDVQARLPAIELLVLISVAAVALFIVNIWRRGWVLPVLAVGLWGFVAVVVGTIYPAIIQRVQVEPNESSREAPYIARNIEATRFALGLQVDTVRFEANPDLDAEDLVANEGTVRNIRLWDPAYLEQSFRRLHEERGYYRIEDVDVDRYMIDGRPQQVLLSARDLQSSEIPQPSWEARHLAFTHGYGAVAASANAKDASGRPAMLVEGIPPESSVPALEITEPAVYFGQDVGSYVIVGTDRQEIDYQSDEATEFRAYDGADGIGVGNFVRRLAFALRFNDVNPLISGNLRSDSRIIIKRDIVDRVKSLAPFLHFDADPYLVVLEGRMKWVADAYTTTDRFPYSQRADNSSLPIGTGLNHSFNYVRNSVKAVVDAYDGTVTYYVIDDEDPLVRAYQRAFPELFTDGDEVPDGLRAHFRYPEDMFRVQTNMWGRYHIDEADDFYNRVDAWSVAQDPGSGGVSVATPVTNEQGVIVSSREARIPPYYLLMRLPGEEQEEFVLFRPFVPLSGDDSARLMTSFMVARSDPEHYGELVTYAMPRSGLPDGPATAAATMSSDPGVAEQQRLLTSDGTNVLLGNILVVPIEQSLLYVRPFYVEAASTRIPELAKVIVMFQGEVRIANTLQEALTALFGSAPDTGETIDEPTTPAPADPRPSDPSLTEIEQLLADADEAFAAADAALRAGNFALFGQRLAEGRDLLQRARELTAADTVTPASNGAA